MRRSRTLWVFWLATLRFLPLRWDAQAQGYPSRPITVVVPFPAGGPSDVVARIVTEQMGKILGQSMVIENVGGAGGTIGSARVAARSPTATRCSRAAWDPMSPLPCSRPT